MIRFVKIFAVIVFIFGLIFYLGYGSILPFTNPEYSLLDNIWLICFPLVFIGLIVGLKWEKIGGYLVTIPIVLSFLVGFFFLKQSLPGPMFVPLLIGLAYIFLGYFKRRENAKQ